MKFNFRDLLVTKTLAVTFIVLILMGNYMLVPRLFGKEPSQVLGLIFNILIYLSVIQSLILVAIISWKSYLNQEDDPDDGES